MVPVSSKFAVTIVFAVSVSVHGVGEAGHPPPLQPVKNAVGVPVAVKITGVPDGNIFEQAAPQAIPAGELLTVPPAAAVPVLTTVSVRGAGGTTVAVKVAVTVTGPETVTAQEPVPLQPPPLQPAKVEPAAGAAVSVTTVPGANGVLQVGGHAMPAGLLVTVPEPVPAIATASPSGPANVAVTEIGAVVIVTRHGPVPLQPPPLQPVKVEPAAGAAVSVTTVPMVYRSEQSPPQPIRGPVAGPRPVA